MQIMGSFVRRKVGRLEVISIADQVLLEVLVDVLPEYKKRVLIGRKDELGGESDQKLLSWY